MGHSFDMLTFHFLLKPPQPITGLFLMIPGPFEHFSENGWSQKSKVFLMKEQSLPLIGLVLGGGVPRPYHGSICFPIQNT